MKTILTAAAIAGLAAAPACALEIVIKDGATAAPAAAPAQPAAKKNAASRSLQQKKPEQKPKPQ